MASVVNRKRKDMDVMKLMMSNYNVTKGSDTRLDGFYVSFHGPKDSPFEGGIWKVHVMLPDAYPYKSPSIGFCNSIFHPNIDETSGSVCLDVINQTWSPMFDLVNIFDAFLPQLLLYPNPTDPLNGEAAALLLQDKPAYNRKVQDYVRRFAKSVPSPGEYDVATNGSESDTRSSTASSSSSSSGLSRSSLASEARTSNESLSMPLDLDDDEDEEFSDIDDV